MYRTCMLNHKMLIKEMRYVNKWRSLSCSCFRRLIIESKKSVHPRSMYRCITLSKSQHDICCRYRQEYSKIHMERLRERLKANIFLRKKNEVQGVSLSYSKNYNLVTVIKTLLILVKG